MAKKKTAVKKPRNRAAQDINLINLRPLKQCVADLTVRVKALEGKIERAERIIAKRLGE